MALTENKQAFRFQRMILTAAGVWPKKNPSLFYKLRCMASFYILLAFAMSLFLSVLYIKEHAPLIESWAMFVSIFNCCLKFGIFYFNTPKLVNLLELLSSSHFTYYDADLDLYIQRAVRSANFVVKLFLTSAICTVVSLCFAPIASSQPRDLPQPFPFDLKEASLPLYVLVYIFQSVAIFTSAWTSTGFDNVATSMMVLSTAYFKILKVTIVRVTNPKSLVSQVGNASTSTSIVEFYGKYDKVINERLSLCVEHHLAVIKFAESVESIFTYIVLLQFLASAVGICLAGFTFTSTPVESPEFLFAISLPITLMFQITLYCGFGNEVTIQSAKIGEACYMTEWVNCGPSVRRTLFIIMERSKRPLVLTAGKFINLSLSSLVAVFRSAISYEAVLRQITHKET